MERVLKWIWLSLKFRHITSKVMTLLEICGGIEGIYYARSFEGIRWVGEKERGLLSDKDLTEARRIMYQIAELGGKILVYDDANYPQILKHLHSPPCVLYIKGKVPELDSVLTIGVVGTRKTTDYGRLATQRICSDLAGAGVVIIGGMAAGIDAVGAWASIGEGGITVGVIGSGLDIVYPRENAELYKAVADEGCIMTEYPPGTPPIGRHFPARNRIIAGLARGILVTEAPPKSGSLITANYALEMGRDVFAVPRNITETAYSGTNRLIQQGAKLVMNAEDILCEYPYAGKIDAQKRDAELYEERVKVASPTVARKPLIMPLKEDNKENAASDRLSGLTGMEKEIADLLLKSDMQIDEMVRELKLSAGELNTKLVMLELKGIVKKMPGGVYRLKV